MAAPHARPFLSPCGYPGKAHLRAPRHRPPPVRRGPCRLGPPNRRPGRTPWGGRLHRGAGRLGKGPRGGRCPPLDTPGAGRATGPESRLRGRAGSPPRCRPRDGQGVGTGTRHAPLRLAGRPPPSQGDRATNAGATPAAPGVFLPPCGSPQAGPGEQNCGCSGSEREPSRLGCTSGAPGSGARPRPSHRRLSGGWGALPGPGRPPPDPGDRSRPAGSDPAPTPILTPHPNA